MDTTWYFGVFFGAMDIVLALVILYYYQPTIKLLTAKLKKSKERLYMLDTGGFGLTYMYVRSKLSEELGAVIVPLTKRSGMSVMDSKLTRILLVFTENGKLKFESMGNSVFLFFDWNQPLAMSVLEFDIRNLHTLYVTISETKRPSTHSFQVNVTTDKKNYEAEALVP